MPTDHEHGQPSDRDPHRTVSDLLHDERERHTPDFARISRRVDEGMRDVPAPAPAGSPWRTWAGPAAAAAAILVVVMVTFVVQRPAPDAEVAGPPAAPSITTAPTAPGAGLEVSAQSVRGPTAVRLSAGNSLDWVVAEEGSSVDVSYPRKDVEQERLAYATSGDNPTATSAEGPFEVEWSGGREPGASGSSDRTWLTVTPAADATAGGVTVRALPGPNRQQVILYAGVQGADATLTVTAGGEVSATPVSATPAGYGLNISVPLDGIPDDQQVEIALTVDGGATVGFAGALLR